MTCLMTVQDPDDGDTRLYEGAYEFAVLLGMLNLRLVRFPLSILSIDTLGG